MKISISIPEANMVTNHGYGVVSYQIVQALQRLGHTVPFQDPTAPVEINISQPNFWRWSSPDSYKIGMVAWESTQVPALWKYGLKTCDELWTPSPLIARWLEDEGYPVTTVFEHGIDATVWTPKLRTRASGPIRFLHIGEPALRKGGQDTFDAFNSVFSAHQAHLTLKTHGGSNVRGFHDNVTVIRDELSETDLVQLVHDHDILVYPSYGEGFGLIPLQAMSTGMPVILSQGWAPYERFAPQDLLVKTRLDDSPWPKVHPGKMLHPDPVDLASSMKFAAQWFNYYSQAAYNKAPAVQRYYDWNRLTEQAFAHILERDTPAQPATSLVE
jgi:glycosyltransferase involved in cell wall biosynthesis